jgi:tetratricopeptide (TPR) repeat protein
VALLVFGLVRRTIELANANPRRPVPPRDIACVAALLWSIHPLTSEPVSYLTQRTESLMAMFFLLALYANVRSHTSRQPRGWMAIAIGACLAGAGCKETIAVAPLAIVFYDRVFVFESMSDALRRRWRLYCGLALTWVALAYLLVSGGQSISAGFESADSSSWTYLLNQPRMILRYLRLAVWPDSLVLYYGWTPAVRFGDVWPYAAGVVVLIGVIVYALTARPALGFLGAFVFLTLGPTSSVVPIATEVGAERRMYLAMAAIVTMVAISLAHLSARLPERVPSRRLFFAFASVLVAALSVLTVMRNHEYSSGLTMALTVRERWPTANADYLVGTELAAVGDRENAIIHLAAAARAYPPANYPLGAQLLAQGRTAEGITALERFITDEPTALASRAAHGLLANALADQQRFLEAIPHYREFLAAHPENADAWNALGVAHIRSDRVDEAIASFRAAVRANPADTRFSQNLERAEALRRQPYK